MADPSELVPRLDSRGEGSFCFRCGSASVEAVQEGAMERYRCSAGHVEDRCFLFDGKALFTIDEGRLVHESVGAIVRRREKILLFRRRKFPPGWTIPAGHLEQGGEPEAEMRREVTEEVGLSVKSARLVWKEGPRLLHDRCRRGADWHRWRLYLVEAEGEPKLGDEGDRFGWFTPQEILPMDLIAPVRTIASDPQVRALLRSPSASS